MSAKKSILFVAAVVVVLGVAAQARADWLPSSVAGLQSWLNPGDSSKLTLSGNNVISFKDSQNGLSFTEYNANYVTYNANAFTGGTTTAGLVYSGSPSLKYNPASSALNLASTNTKWAIFAVVNINTSPSIDQTIESVYNGSPYAEDIFQVSKTGQLQFYPSGTGWIKTATGAVSLGTAHILEMEYSGGTGPTLQFYVDGVAKAIASGTVTQTIGLNAGQTFYVGSQAGSGNQLSGKMGDVLNFNQVLSDTDRNNVGAYLQTKYGISGSYVGIPEPSTLALLAAGLAGLLAYAWRKRK